MGSPFLRKKFEKAFCLAFAAIYFDSVHVAHQTPVHTQKNK